MEENYNTVEYYLGGTADRELWVHIINNLLLFLIIIKIYILY
eukprot:SAG11_NODE_2745_length_3018_cov_3.931141_2_plen_42_part_00